MLPSLSGPVMSLRVSRLPIATGHVFPKAGSRSFEALRTRSRIPVRKVSPPLPSSDPSAGHLSSTLAGRREARQGRSRPWAEPPKRVAPRRTQTGTPYLPSATRGPTVKFRQVDSGSSKRSATVTSRQAKNVPAKAVTIRRWRALASSAPLKRAPSSSSVGGRSKLPIAKAKVMFLPCTREVNSPWNRATSMFRSAIPP